jgi:carbon-monoxide dehydrogenase small subunit/xanthine dehydrogenase YagT iron-sulfur-binding subunit
MPDDRFEVSRRDVLKGAGAAAFLGAVAREAQAKKADENLRRVGPEPVTIEFKVNGKASKVLVEPRVTLLDALRERMELTGTKQACDRGACGACTVWVNGKTANACMMLAIDAAGAEITTIEGLARGEKLHPVQQAFVEKDALQCGFCTPGMIMSCAALHAKNNKPKPEEVRAAIAGHLCRCGTYPHIFDAMAEVGR